MKYCQLLSLAYVLIVVAGWNRGAAELAIGWERGVK